MSHAEKFREMAAAIERNPEEAFGGACLIISPSGQAVSVVILDGSKEEGQFWGLVQSRCQMAVAEVQSKQQQANIYNRR